MLPQFISTVNFKCSMMFKSSFTFTERHGGIPGTVSGACDGGETLGFHHVARLAHKSDVLSNGKVLTISQPICWHSGVSAVDH